MTGYAKGRQTQEMLIHAAGELVAERGFSNVSIRAIAEKAGQNIGAIHYHFKTKENLFQAVIRNATRPIRDNPLSGLILAHAREMDTPAGQARILRRVIRHKIHELFTRDRPWWHHKIIYQILRAEDALLKTLKEVIVPEVMTFKTLFMRINPDLDEEEAFIQTLLTITPIIYHAENAENILDLLKKDRYSRAYLQKLEDRLVHQTQLSLGLPTDNT